MDDFQQVIKRSNHFQGNMEESYKQNLFFKKSLIIPYLFRLQMQF